MVVGSGVHPSLPTNCHHQILYCKLNLNIKSPPPYESLVGDYKKSDIKKIKKSIERVNSEDMFYHKDPNQQAPAFNITLINIFSNFVLNSLVTFGDREPPWMDEFVTIKIKWKNKIYKDYIKNGITKSDYFMIQSEVNAVSEIIDKMKNDYNSSSIKIK